MARVVVLGAGLAGAASAVRLAKLGHEVTVVERLPDVGGAVGLLEQDGFRWDAGPASTALPAVLRDLFRKSGRPLDREAELLPVQPMRQHRFPDGTVLDLPSGSRADQLAAVDAALGTGRGRAWVDHVRAFAEPWDRLRRDWLERPYAPELAAEETRRLLDTRRSLAAAVAHLDDPRLRRVATHHTVRGGHDPGRAPAWLGILDYVEQNFGTWTFAGGFGTLASLLARRLRERRVTLLASTAARDIAMGADGPRAVLTDDGPLPADHVVVAIDPRLLPALARFVRRTTPAAPAEVTHLGLCGSSVGGLPQEVVIHSADGSLLVLHTGVRSPGQTGPPGVSVDTGRQAWTVQRTRPPGRRRPPPSTEEDVLRVLARAGLDVRDRVETRLDRSPAGIVEHLGGSPAGVRWEGRGTVRRRLGTLTPLPGVLLAGAHTGGGSWLPFVGLSAAQVAEHVGKGR